jgi:23S rRNA (uridine2552-2'-O)-methyltransferase
MAPKGKKKNTWQDHYTRKAKKDKYPARSVYKLEEIQQKFKLIRSGRRVLDLGCAPGSWLQYAARLVGTRGQVVGVDLKPVSGKIPANAVVYTGDIFDEDAGFWNELVDPFDLILSDMAPNTTGNSSVDAARSFYLCEAALAVARKRLAPGGAFVCKIFQGEEFEQMVVAVREVFKQCKIFKPQSCRKASKEIYIIGMNRKQEA